jgi:S-adenosyl methyltransferase
VADDWTTTVNTGVPNPARIYDYLLDGKDNFPADRDVAEQLLAIAPVARDVVEDNRAFLRRVVRLLAGEAGIRQFNDPMVVTHSRALLAGDNTAAIRADLRDPDVLLGHAELRELIDFDQPIALLLMAILHFFGDDEDPYGIVARFRDTLPAGSYLAISHCTRDIPERSDLSPAAMAEMGAKVERLYQLTTASLVTRSRAQVQRFFAGFDLLDPGVVEIQLWRPDGEGSKLPGGFYGGVGRKP